MPKTVDEEIIQEDDGTFTIDVDVSGVEPIRGITTLAQADHIRHQLWAMESSGAKNAMIET